MVNSFEVVSGTELLAMAAGFSPHGRRAGAALTALAPRVGRGAGQYFQRAHPDLGSRPDVWGLRGDVVQVEVAVAAAVDGIQEGQRRVAVRDRVGGRGRAPRRP